MLFVDATALTATTPAHAAGSVDVTVTNSDGQSSTLINGYTYVSTAPTISSVTPNSGPGAGGTGVTITGTNFVPGTTVAFGGTPAADMVVVGPGTINATTPAHAGGAVAVTVANPDGQSGSRSNAFTYLIPAPTITGATPLLGPTIGGTTVTISGNNLAAGATVKFGGNAAANVVVVDSHTITASTPPHAAGIVDVVVINPDAQSATLPAGFSYVSTAPTVTSVAPASGTALGGTTVTITGTNFSVGAGVTFGAAAGMNVVVTSATSLIAVTPAHLAGVINVIVTNPDTQSGALANAFTYVSTAPTVASISPTTGSTTGETNVTITGTNFMAGAVIKFGNALATNVNIVSGTSITAISPAATAGTVAISVTNADGQSGTLSNGFTYFVPASAINFVRVAYATPQSSVTAVSVAYSGTQTAGDLNIVVVGWNDVVSDVLSVTDSAGNVYSRGIGPTTGTGLRQSIYYSSNIVGGANTVTVTFNRAAAHPDVRILEYRGVTTLDKVAGASGRSSTSSSGPVTTTAANELIFGANMVSSMTKSPGTSFTSRVITSPDSDIAEDRIVNAIGAYSATANTATGYWIMQIVTFK